MAGAPDISDLPVPPSATDISDLPVPPAPVGTVDNNPVMNVADAGLKSVGRGIVHAGADLYRRITGGDTTAPDPTISALQPTAQESASVAALAASKPVQLAKTLLSKLPHHEGPPTDIPGLGPTVSNIARQGAAVTADVLNLAPLTQVGKLSKLAELAPEFTTSAETTAAAQAVADRAAASTSGGAAAVPVDVSKLSQPTQAALAAIKDTPNATALGRVHEAESLPVPLAGESGLTEGQARGDAGMISDEFNAKGEEGNRIGVRYDNQDQALKDNLATMHREAAPETVGNNEIQNGQAVIDSLKAYDVPKKAAITDAYTAAKTANGGDLQMDGSNFVKEAQANLKPQGKARFLPPVVQGILDDVKAGGGKMSLDDFEGYRTALANEARKAARSGDGNAAAAIGQVREALEATPTAGASAAAKALYDNARGLARERFAELDADPAYKAAVEDDAKMGEPSDLADKFMAKYVQGAPQAALQRLRPKLDSTGGQAMTSSTMNFLQKGAGINPDTGAGTFSNAGYNNALTKITPKIKELLGNADLIDDTRKLGNVANYVQKQTRGGYANTSHTHVAGKSESMSGAVAEQGANAAAFHLGLPLPVGTIVRKGAGALRAFNRANNRKVFIDNALKPGAGLED